MKKRSSTATLARQRRGPGLPPLVDEDGEFIDYAPYEVAESIRYLLVRTRASGGGDLPNRFGLTSAIRGEGVTYLARTIAYVLAHDAGREVCLVDLNWWAPSEWATDQADLLGMADVIRGKADVGDVLRPGGHPGLQFLPAGVTSELERPALANHPELDKTLVELSHRFDHVILDLPAVHATSEALNLAESCGTVALVVCQGVTPELQVSEAIEELAGVKLLGVILNRSTSKVPGWIRRRVAGA